MDVDNQHQTHDLSSSKQAQVVVIMVPFPAQSHLNQLLQLSCLISSYNIPVHYTCSATHIHQAKLRFNDTNHLSFAQIHFHEFPTPPFLSPPPNPNASSKFPSHLLPSFEASVHLHNPMTELLQEISSTARRVILSTMLSWLMWFRTPLPYQILNPTILTPVVRSLLSSMDGK
ncbi:hypothetical protein ACSBR2_034162 [Camellia fascicularis]